MVFSLYRFSEFLVKKNTKTFQGMLYRLDEFLFIYIANSKNVVVENGEWQLSNGDCTTERNCGFHLW